VAAVVWLVVARVVGESSTGSTAKRADDEDGSSAPEKKNEKKRAFGVAAGRPIGMRRPGVYVWRDLRGAWHVRIAPRRGPFPVTGSVRAVDGDIDEVDRRELEKKDVTEHDGAEVRFRFTTGPDADGLVVFTEADCVRVDLSAGGQRHPERIRIGRRATPPQRVPFILCRGASEIRYE
jgi:hypothetical protein